MQPPALPSAKQYVTSIYSQSVMNLNLHLSIPGERKLIIMRLNFAFILYGYIYRIRWVNQVIQDLFLAEFILTDSDSDKVPDYFLIW